MSTPLAVITGATKGLGRATTLAFARAGWETLGLYSTDERAADELRAELAPLDTPFTILRSDVATAEIGAHAALATAPRLALVNNACAAFSPQPLHLIGDADLRRQFEVTLEGAWRCTRALLRPLLRTHGCVINVLSDVTHGTPPPGFAAYAIAKHALRGLTLALAAEYAERGVRVVSISPGFMETALTAGWDARLAQAISASARRSDPAAVATRIIELALDDHTPGRGEDYTV